MENKVINVDFESMTSEQLMEIQEKAKETRLKKADNKIGKLQDSYKKINNAIKILKEENKELKEQVKQIQIETNQVTKTLLTHGKERRELENHLHKIIYNELSKDSIRDKLFHGDLTRICKAEICQSLNISSFLWIEVKDVDIAKRLAYKSLNKESIHRIMRKRTTDLLKKYDKLEAKNTKLTDREKRQSVLLNELLEEVNGNASEI
ncbi:hypothetical protein G8V07_14250 [Clostridium botulinum D/C]|uniref:hypothetical protein n=1 Tax=Clostridium botulinum TaxID=1491 RepID=UPI001E39B688|nr:hypothetical protein [Clostridium botulinum]MCD3319536.1 hypothetical protein [Clostridium botulinum D/C]MCD3324886.1 hypothetical protein [Clostridium botulinum D/C]MCD3327716.1 hypothetical protein [Clostridium botulinum D/C]